MRSTIKFLWIIAIAAAIIFSTAACNRGSSSGASASSNPVNSSAIDRLIDEFELFMEEYLVIMQKMIEGDFSVVSEAMRLEDRMDDWAERMEAYSENDFTQAQRNRMEEISNRFTFGF